MEMFNFFFTTTLSLIIGFVFIVGIVYVTNWIELELDYKNKNGFFRKLNLVICNVATWIGCIIPFLTVAWIGVALVLLIVV